MTVTSTLVFCWFSVTVLVYWAVPGTWRRSILLAASFGFLTLVAPASAALLAALAALTYTLPRLWPRPEGALLGALLVVLVLIAFKSADALEPDDILIPLGLSYYTFRCIHYLIESYKGHLVEHDFIQFSCYLCFYPTIIAGPIHRFNEFQRDIADQRWKPELFSRGCERILYGYAQIVILGNWLIARRLESYISGLDPESAALVEYLECVAFGANIYFQFAGYSSVAIGFALLLGFRIIENFNHPFIRPNISAFWRSWHISLSSWCRDYVFMPTAATTRSIVLGTVAAMVVIGLWHEISLRYLAWGLYHAAGIVVWQRFQRIKRRLPQARAAWARAAATAAAVALTFNFVMLSFAITKESSLGDAWNVFAIIFLSWL